MQSAHHSLNLIQHAYQSVLQQTIEDAALQPLGFTLDDLSTDPEDDNKVPQATQQMVFEQAAKIRQNFKENVRLLAAAVDQNGAELRLIAGGNTRHLTDLGYHVIGSGRESAQLTFTRRRYDRRTTTANAIFTAVEAKRQAEERRGVGQDLDLIRVTSDSIYTFGQGDDADEGELGEILDLLDRIDEEQREVRENVISEWDKPYE